MQIDPQLQHVLIIICTLLVAPPTSALIGTSVASALKQDGFSPAANGAIAWTTLLLMAAASAYAAHNLTGGYSVFLDAAVGAGTLLISGPLSQLRPYLIWLNFVQTHAFNVVPAQDASGHNTQPMKPV